MRRSIAALVGAAVMALGGVSSAGASMATEPVEIDLTGEVIPAHPCVEEAILITSGSELLVDRFGADAAGGSHVRLLAVSKAVSGTGVTTGTTYRITGNEVFVLNESEDGSEFLLRVGTNLISQGSGDNFVASFLLKVTIDATGTPKAEFVRGSDDCRG